MYDRTCRQFLVNLLVTGYRITNPEGVDITEEALEDAVEEINSAVSR
jgi:hypothetical protein